MKTKFQILVVAMGLLTMAAVASAANGGGTCGNIPPRDGTGRQIGRHAAARVTPMPWWRMGPSTIVPGPMGFFRWGPGDGTGYGGDGPMDGTGYGPGGTGVCTGIGTGICDGTGPKGNLRGPRR